MSYKVKSLSWKYKIKENTLYSGRKQYIVYFKEIGFFNYFFDSWLSFDKIFLSLDDAIKLIKDNINIDEKALLTHIKSSKFIDITIENWTKNE